MAIQNLGDNDSAQVFRTKANSNFNELNTLKAPINHSSPDNTYGVATSANYGHVKITTGNGLTNNSGTLSMAAATTSAAGAVQLVNNATTNDATKAATAAALKSVADSVPDTYYGSSTPDVSLGKVGDIYIKVV